MGFFKHLYEREILLNIEMFLWEQRQDFLGNRTLWTKATSLPTSNIAFTFPLPWEWYLGPLLSSLNVSICLNPNRILLFQRPQVVHFSAKIWFAKHMICQLFPMWSVVWGAGPVTALWSQGAEKESDLYRAVNESPALIPLLLLPVCSTDPLILLCSCNLALCLSNIFFFSSAPFIFNRLLHL